MKNQSFSFKAIAQLLCFYSITVLSMNLLAASNNTALEHAYQIVDELFNDDFLSKTSELVKIKTYRAADRKESLVVEELERIREKLKQWVDTFNQQQKTQTLQFFEWKQTIAGRTPWLFGFRLGNGKRRIAIITHLDTVAPGNSEWRPFEPRVEKRDYIDGETDFLIGRGALDDKGPAVVSLIALKAIAQQFDNSDKLKDFTLEIIFDTSEETQMSMPDYFAQNPDQVPELGIVYDAMWTVAYEKGIERPVFTVPLGTTNTQGLWLDDFNTYPGPSNQIPDSTTAVIKAENSDIAQAFSQNVRSLYKAYTFDDPYYRKADLSVDSDDQTITLTTRVSGAQHGSAPQENREKGANPLVSLGGFLAHLIKTKQLNSNGIGQMLKFMQWTWGTHTFGEDHSDLLQRHDDIFALGNGTTYAMTQFITDKTKQQVSLAIDIRYALYHHSKYWDGKTWGILTGDSQFKEIFSTLVSLFNNTHKGPTITFTTQTAVGPDLKDKNSQTFQKATTAYKDVIGTESPILAIGGGTDAKGHAELIAAGSLFTDSLGPPVNFHGIDEGAPIEDMRKGARILYRVFLNEVMEQR